MATPTFDQDYENRKQAAKELIAAGGCSAITFWSRTDAERLCPDEHKSEVDFDPIEAPVYISDWITSAKKAVELIKKGIDILESKQG